MSTNYGSPSREKGFTMASDIFRTNGGKVIVETGCYWMESQGRSTVHLAQLAHSVGGEFHSVDLNPSHVEFAKKQIAGIPNATVHCSDSLEWLGKYNGKIDFLYLDAFDWDEKNHQILSIYNLAELGACLGKMSPKAVILMDDWYNGTSPMRKPMLSNELLKYRGWKLINSDYQLLYAR